MDRSSKAITLALIGSAILLGGCSNGEEEEEEQRQAGGHGGGVFIAPRVGRAMGGVTAAPSARGGFGATGATGVGS